MTAPDDYSAFFIGGRWTTPQGSDTLTVTSPFTGEAIAHVPAASAEDVDAAVAAARRAFDQGEWPRITLDERMQMLGRLSELLGKRTDEIANLVTSEMGCPITLSRSMQAAGPRVLLDSFLELAPSYPWRAERESATGRALVLREPVGVVAAVVPWNAPLLISVMKLAPALLAGCTVVLKPAPETPLDAYLLAGLLEEAGLPEGVVNVVPADRDVSEHLVTHPQVDKVAFTGSTAAGRRIASLCGHDLKRVTLELGGKSAAVLLDDADLAGAAESLRVGSFRNSGQVCSLKTRVVVPRARQAEFLEAFSAVVGSMPVGDPADPATQIGPLVSARQRERVEGYIAAGRDQGARVVVGGGRPSGFDAGYFVEPTVFADVAPGMRIAQEEIFGPVVSVLAYDDEDEAVALANDSSYGLNGSVFTGDPGRGVALASRMRTGTVEVNGSPVGFHAPIGGFKSSGIGREAGPEGFDAYVELKSIGLPRDLILTS
ncbi:aldehyde dehydrogenase [Actinomycetospora endophytica]|uniref:Aldehyde dehydrogenase n=1 Tax=Actinomycetospora endophytica TaxID=2291215 RepID=A0ABS8PJI4_9PSEU|nr:aldehyde dehydrogenase [Actinomycetospora endophytica]MCD2197675.1 aldehyde dehydrogenase [Actinomycetospora endophytica]